MINYVKDLKISQIFSIDDKTMYQIPKYQRKYTWGQNEWNLLFNDIIENNDGYFLGSSITVSTNNNLLGNRVAEIIDGQQRLTTLSIAFAALYSRIAEFKQDLNEDELNDLINIKKALAIKNEDNKYVPRLELQIQDYNRDDYNSLLFECNIIDINIKKKPNAGNRKIYKAYRFFDKLITNFLNNDEFEDNNLKTNSTITTLFNLVNRFKNAIIVFIQVDSHQDAYMLFESLNNRGVPLTAIDLMQNLLISISDKDNKSEDCYNNWIEIKNNISDEYSIQERFFRQYYNAFREELNKPFMNDNQSKMFPLAYLATKTTLMNIYQKLIERDYEKFIEDMMQASKVYAELINNTDEKPSYANNLLDLSRIQGAPSYLLLLYLFLEKENLSWEISFEEEIKKIIDLLTLFFVRRNLTDIPNTRSLTTLFMNIIDNIKNQKNLRIYDVIRNKLIEVSASDEDFLNKLQDSIYDINKDAARYILCSLETKHQTKEIYTDLWQRDEHNNYVWTIEHIFPEGENIPKTWVDMIADGDINKANEYRDLYVHTVGNLTVSGYNSSLSNKSFGDKKNRQKDGKYVGYKNGLYLNEDVVIQDKWTIDLIKQRTKKLSNEALELFKF